MAIYLGDGGVDGYRGEFSNSGQIAVYQSKYFTNPWSDSQKQKIRQSFDTAADAKHFNLKDWFLCVPTRLTRQDLAWFDSWKGKQTVPVGLVDGDDLTQLLDGANGARTRQRFRDWGVFTVRNGSPIMQARIACVKNVPGAFRNLRLFLLLENRGDRTAEGIRVKIGHSPTHCVAGSHNVAFWNDLGSGALNPRALSAKLDII